MFKSLIILFQNVCFHDWNWDFRIYVGRICHDSHDKFVRYAFVQEVDFMIQSQTRHHGNIFLFRRHGDVSLVSSAWKCICDVLRWLCLVNFFLVSFWGCILFFEKNRIHEATELAIFPEKNQVSSEKNWNKCLNEIE